ncbi:MAG: hypothetical protein ACJ72E_11630, partial [Marmoricola sp.]
TEATTSGLRHALGAGAVFAAAAAVIAWATKNTFEEAAAVPERRRVLVVGRSPGVLLETVALLRERGYEANATNQFDDVLEDYDVSALDVLVFGGMVPLDRKAQLRTEALRLNPDLTILQGMVGIAAVIAAQVESAGADASEVEIGERSLRLRLPAPAPVRIVAHWASFADLQLADGSAQVLDTRLEAGDHVVVLPSEVPAEASFVVVTIDRAVSVHQVGAIPETITSLVPATAADNVLPPVEVVRT